MARAPDFGTGRAVAVSTALFDGYPMALALDEIAAAGGSYAEPAYIRGYVQFDESAFSTESASAFARDLASAGLKSVAVSAHLDMALPEAPDMLRRRIGFAREIGARHIITNTGARVAEAPILRAIAAVLPDCEDAGVGLALENPGHGSGDLIGNGAEGAALVARIASPLVRLNYDAGNILTYSDERVRPEDDVAEALPALAHLHLKDVAADGPDWRFTPLGGGMIDYVAVWQQIPQDLPVAIELPLRLRRPNRADPQRHPEPLALVDLRAALRHSLAFVERLEEANAGDAR